MILIFPVYVLLTIGRQLLNKGKTMVRVYRYQAMDGKLFINEIDCLEYESRLLEKERRLRKVKSLFYKWRKVK